MSPAVRKFARLAAASPPPAPEPSALPLALDAKSLERVFGAGGWLAAALPGSGRTFEHRPEQLEMARAISDSIRDRAHLLVEAGTGVGKSYAYLVPFILWAVQNKKRVLIATGTKALQQQLVERDLPFLKELFSRKSGLDFQFALCLGTGNYICPRRLAKAQVAGLFATPEEVLQLKDIHDFAEKSKTGRNLDMDFEPMAGLWAQVNRESDLCLGRNCAVYEQSFFYMARREQEKAQILVANHHLLFAHLASGSFSGGVLPQFDALVIDGAHNAEDVASSYLGIEISNLATAKLLEILASRRSSRTVMQGAKWAGAGEQESKLIDAANEARAATALFFENLQLAVPFEPNRNSSIRILRPQLLSNELDEPFARLEDVLRQARKSAEREQDESMAKELDGFALRCTEIRSHSQELLNQMHAGYVYWASSQPRPADNAMRSGPRAPRLSLNGAPIEVAAEMQRSLFAPFATVVLTSATLTTGGSFDFLRERLGLGGDLAPAPDNLKFKPATSQPKVHSLTISIPKSDKEGAETTEREVRTLTLGSPFNFRENALLYIARDLPDPGTNASLFEEAAIKRAAEVVKCTDGRAFVLCTSFRMVDATARFLEKVLPKKIRVLKQGAMARGRLLNEFRADVHSVLVGTTSFWQGVDVPGESLSCVVIMKLPFAVPDEPIVQARIETLKSKGRDAFSGYQVPQAVMMFRQGFGRLIRTAEDRGIVAILDPRVRTKRYGATFLESLPDCGVCEDLKSVEEFARGDK